PFSLSRVPSSTFTCTSALYTLSLHDALPILGAAALAGTTFPIDRKFTAKELDFDNIYANSLDAVSDRYFVLEFLSNASILMMHRSEEHTSELQSRFDLVCRLLLEKKQ